MRMSRSIRLHVRLESEGVEHREWIFDDPKIVTIGYLSSASIWLKDAAAGPCRTLFRRRGREIHFRFASDLQGTLRIGQKEIFISDLREAGLLNRDANGDYVIMREKTSGTVTLGKNVFRFWVSRPPDKLEYPSHLRPLVLLRNVQPLFTLALFLSFVIHALVFKGFSLLPPIPEPDIQEVQARYARFTLPQVDYVKQHWKQPTEETAKTPSSKPSEPKERMIAPKTTGGFLAAVASSRSRTASPFAKLFTTETLGKSLTEALEGKTLESAIANQLSGPRSTRTDLGKAQAPVQIGSLRQTNLAKAEIKVQVSGPTVASFATESAQVEGTLDRGALEQLVQQNSGQIRDCYERSLTRNPALSGKVVVSLVVQLDGRPSSVSISESSIPDRLFTQCIVTRVGTWLFPRPEGAPTPVRFPFIFTAASRG
jgi:hypothetical protein